MSTGLESAKTNFLRLHQAIKPTVVNEIPGFAILINSFFPFELLVPIS